MSTQVFSAQVICGEIVPDDDVELKAPGSRSARTTWRRTAR